MKAKLLFAFLFIRFVVSAQYTLIPDIYFENKLIALHIDSGVPDGKVLTNTVKSLTYLNVSNCGINDLTGIQDFLSLNTLTCDGNNLTNLDVSKNTLLAYLTCNNNHLANLDVSNNTALVDLIVSTNQLANLDVSKNVLLDNLNCEDNDLATLDVSKNIDLKTLSCAFNKIASLDVSTNTALTELQCYKNQLASLDVSKNTALTSLWCYSNKITTLDVSNKAAMTLLNCGSNLLTSLNIAKDTNLKYLYCNFNNLTSLNLSDSPSLIVLDCDNNHLTSLDVSKNTVLYNLFCLNNNLTSLNLKNGTKSINTNSHFINNPNLTCIQVDDTTYAYNNWSGAKDLTAIFATDCPALGTKAITFNKMSIYPNPTKGELHIDNVTLKEATVYDASGKLVKSVCFDNASDKNTLNLSGLTKGVYYLCVESEGTHTAEKIVIE